MIDSGQQKIPQKQLAGTVRDRAHHRLACCLGPPRRLPAPLPGVTSSLFVGWSPRCTDRALFEDRVEVAIIL